jgi:hypothetical protein
MAASAGNKTGWEPCRASSGALGFSRGVEREDQSYKRRERVERESMEKKEAQRHELKRLGRFYTEMAAVGLLNRLASEGKEDQSRRCLMRLEHGYWVVYDPGP